MIREDEALLLPTQEPRRVLIHCDRGLLFLGLCSKVHMLVNWIDTIGYELLCFFFKDRQRESERNTGRGGGSAWLGKGIYRGRLFFFVLFFWSLCIHLLGVPLFACCLV